jgi:hypothetical protein
MGQADSEMLIGINPGTSARCSAIIRVASVSCRVVAAAVRHRASSSTALPRFHSIRRWSVFFPTAQLHRPPKISTLSRSYRAKDEDAALALTSRQPPNTTENRTGPRHITSRSWYGSAFQNRGDSGTGFLACRRGRPCANLRRTPRQML